MLKQTFDRTYETDEELIIYYSLACGEYRVNGKGEGVRQKDKSFK
jgi:hypothetical protein